MDDAEVRKEELSRKDLPCHTKTSVIIGKTLNNLLTMVVAEKLREWPTEINLNSAWHAGRDESIKIAKSRKPFVLTLLISPTKQIYPTLTLTVAITRFWSFILENFMLSFPSVLTPSQQKMKTKKKVEMFSWWLG